MKAIQLLPLYCRGSGIGRVAQLFLMIVALIVAGCVAPRPTGRAVRARTALAAADESTVSSMAHAHTYAGIPVPSNISSEYTLLENEGYAVGYSESRKTPVWAAYRVFALDDFETFDRPSKFKVDERTEAGVHHDDYKYTGFDRGHMAPNFAVMSRYGRVAQLETFLMSNVCPQCPGLNQEPWEALEKRIADDYANDFEEVWVISGPIFSSNPEALDAGVSIPSKFFSIVVDEEGGNPAALAIIMTQQTKGVHPLSAFVTTVREIETQTNLDFFAPLPDNIENQLETSPADARWRLDRDLVPSRGTRPRAPCPP